MCALSLQILIRSTFIHLLELTSLDPVVCAKLLHQTMLGVRGLQLQTVLFSPLSGVAVTVACMQHSLCACAYLVQISRAGKGVLLGSPAQFAVCKRWPNLVNVQ